MKNEETAPINAKTTQRPTPMRGSNCSQIIDKHIP